MGEENVLLCQKQIGGGDCPFTIIRTPILL